jgi:hypothetical protein
MADSGYKISPSALPSWHAKYSDNTSESPVDVSDLFLYKKDLDKYAHPEGYFTNSSNSDYADFKNYYVWSDMTKYPWLANSVCKDFYRYAD